MRKLATAVTAAAALLAGPALEAKPRLTPQQELAKLLEGREPGKPTNCVSNSDTREMRVLDKTAIVFGWGNTIWVNVPKNAEDLDDDDVLVTKTFGSQLCSLDIVYTMDRSSRITTGFINLGDFVPYRRVPKPAKAN
ncbi:MAG: hypothetical protein KGZ65_10975 [Sphingomonadales bacterium]|nr:hypothetical protein [Sphingomonadaceae bacterium]MBS3931749.1 hypothetical protein [Sphingomonadales bacterium]